VKVNFSLWINKLARLSPEVIQSMSLASDRMTILWSIRVVVPRAPVVWLLVPKGCISRTCTVRRTVWVE